MFTIHKKVVIDKKGQPKEVLIPWNEFKEIEEMLGLDLDKTAINDLKQAKKDREEGNKNAYKELDSI